MAGKLTDFVLNLSQDSEALKAFRKDPETTMTNAGLSPAEQVIVGARDSQALRDAVFADIGHKVGDAATEWVIVLVNVQTKGSIQ